MHQAESAQSSASLDDGERGAREPVAKTGWLAPVAIFITGTLAYATSFQGAFVFDEYDFITNNADIRRLWPPWPALLGPLNVNRPLIGLSNAMNYAISGLNPWSYHVVNLLIHLVAGLALYGIIRRTLLMGGLRDRFGKRATELALVIALIWVVHPLQTQSVIYIIQRCESLMGMFYLVTLYSAIRAFGSEKKTLWYTCAIAACAGGMLSKQVMVTAPLLVLLYDVMFAAGSFRAAISSRLPLYVGLAATWAVLAATMIAAPVNMTAGFAVQTVSSWEYAKTELGVVPYYLRLSIWPSPLCLDYLGWPKATAISSVLPYALLMAVICGLTVWAIARRKAAGFAGAWFLLILAVTSSVMPFSDFVFEHRMYLPLAGVVALAVVGCYSLAELGLRKLGPGSAQPVLLKKLALGLVTVVVASLAFATARRNIDYRSEVVMWRDVIAKRPDNPRGHTNLGRALMDQGKLEEAQYQLIEGLKLDSSYSQPHYDLGVIFVQTGRFAEAKIQFLDALEITPTDFRARYNFAEILITEGHPADAIPELEQTLRTKPDYAEAHMRLAYALEVTGRLPEAKAQYLAAVQIRPDWSETVMAHFATLK